MFEITGTSAEVTTRGAKWVREDSPAVRGKCHEVTKGDGPRAGRPGGDPARRCAGQSEALQILYHTCGEQNAQASYLRLAGRLIGLKRPRLWYFVDIIPHPRPARHRDTVFDVTGISAEVTTRDAVYVQT